MRRSLLTAYDVLSPLLAACLVVLVAAPPAHAYVDPSVMTYTIQALAGVAVALSAVLGVALRRTRRMLFRVLKIDENANKIVDPAVEAAQEGDPESGARLARADERAVRDKALLDHGPEARALPWPQRFLRALLGCGFLILTVFIAAPLEVVAASSESLNFGFFNALPVVLGAGIAAILACALLLSLARGRAFDVLLALVVALGVCCYVQSLLLNGPLPAADGSPLDLSKFKRITVISTVAWIAIVAAFLLLNARKKTVCRPALMVICAALVIMQGASLVSIGTEQQNLAGSNTSQSVMTANGLYDVSSNDNVIVFVLDMFDTQLLEDLIESDPSVLDEFTGFTYFRNSTGSMIPTRFGVPFLLTGEFPRDDDNYDTFINERYNRSRFVKDIADAGYDIGIYTDTLRTRKLDNLVDNIVVTQSFEVNEMQLLSSLARMSLYRDAPWILKPLFWFYTDEINKSAVSVSSDSKIENEGIEPYVMDDISYAQKLREDGLTVNASDKSFRFIHLLGPHPPFVADEYGNEATGESNKWIQGHGSLTVVSDYLKQLKEIGVYDKATIIVTSDHGEWYLTQDTLDKPASPILLAKPSESSEQASKPVVVSDVPTGHVDFTSTVINAVGGDVSKYGPTFYEIEGDDRIRYYWTTTSESSGNQDIDLIEYEIDGHVLDFNNWRLTGTVIPILPTNER